MRCDYCGAPYDDKDHFCRNCGVRFKDPADMPDPVQVRPMQPSPLIATRRRRMKRTLTVAAACIVILALAAVTIAQLMPDIVYLSMGGKPKDLGVAYAEADYQSILAKTEIRADAPPESLDRREYTDRYTGTRDVDWTFTETELTAWFNLEPQPGYWPFENVQMKLHDDNVIEVALGINAAKLMTFDSVTRQLPREIISFLSGLPEPIPAYAKAKITFTGPKQVEVKMLSFEAANLPVSAMGVSDEANQIMKSILDGAFESVEQAHIESFTTEEGKLTLTGTWYEQISRVPVQ